VDSLFQKHSENALTSSTNSPKSDPPLRSRAQCGTLAKRLPFQIVADEITRLVHLRALARVSLDPLLSLVIGGEEFVGGVYQE
jgi:hypothetical protein